MALYRCRVCRKKKPIGSINWDKGLDHPVCVACRWEERHERSRNCGKAETMSVAELKKMWTH